MLYLSFGIFCNVILLIILKSFNKFGIPVMQGIVVNYFTAGTTAFIFIEQKNNIIAEINKCNWLGASIVLGFLFISIFYLISVTAQKISISVASVANKMSVVIPVVAAFILYNDSITTSKIIGICLAMIAVYYTTKTNNVSKADHNTKLSWLPILVFIGSGIIDAIVNYANKILITDHSHDALFTAIGFYMAGSIGLIILIYQLIVLKEKFLIKSILAGILLGIPNFFSIYFILKALGTGVLESSQLYPVANIFIVLFSSIAGVFLFKEKLSQTNIIGITLAIVAIILIML